MSYFLISLIATLFTLGFLVLIHEAGHFWVARLLGVKVLQFSVGFGPAIWQHRGRDGTLYSLCCVPLGGFVRMLDEREGKVEPQALAQAFNRQPLTTKIAVVLAGPMANFLLTIVLLWVVFMVGRTSLIPIIGRVLPESPAAVAGLRPLSEITAIGQTETRSWHDISMALMSYLGTSGDILVTTRGKVHRAEEHVLPVKNWLRNAKQPDPITGLGIKPWLPSQDLVIKAVVPSGPAARAGIRSGDRLRSLGGKKLTSWQDWVRAIQINTERPVAVEVLRGTDLVRFLVQPQKRFQAGRAVGFIGVQIAPYQLPASTLRLIRYTPLAALGRSLQQTLQLAGVTFAFIKKMLLGQLSVANLSGPIGIGKVAGISVSMGLISFLNFLALVSLSLGVLNLLPIPALDGGHLLFYFIEACWGRPVPERVQQLCLKFGMVIVIIIMTLAIYNDLVNL